MALTQPSCSMWPAWPRAVLNREKLSPRKLEIILLSGKGPRGDNKRPKKKKRGRLSQNQQRDVGNRQARNMGKETVAW
jgi:hypothetical protein